MVATEILNVVREIATIGQPVRPPKLSDVITVGSRLCHRETGNVIAVVQLHRADSQVEALHATSARWLPRQRLRVELLTYATLRASYELLVGLEDLR